MFSLSENVVFKKGFLLTVLSSENDYDNLNTKCKWFATFDEAKTFIECVEHYAAQFGNLYRGGSRRDVEERFDKSVFTDAQLRFIFSEDGKEIDFERYDKWSKESTECMFDILGEMSYEILGGSENYYCRVLERYAIHEIKEDVTFAIVA